MWLAEIWRYPVKSMAGEQLTEARLTIEGIEGDRIVQVQRADGRILTARTRPKLLGHRAVLGADGEPLVDGQPYKSVNVEAAAGAGARLVRSDREDRFDILPLLVATDGAIAAVRYDTRRFRPNLVIGGVPGLAERECEGGQILIGEVVIGTRDLRGRCIMTTFDPDTGKQDLEVLRRVQREFEGVLGLNSYVIRAGVIAVGTPVEFVPPK
jgi:uncharacterized protein YcbX